MSLSKVAKALLILREHEVMEKTSGVSKTVGDVWKAVSEGAAHAGKGISKSVHPLAGSAVKYSPHAAVAVGGKKAYESEPSQKMRYKLRVWKHNRALKKAQKAQGYY